MASEPATASLAQLAETEVALTWSEALALIQQICRALLDRPGDAPLDQAGILIQPTGDVTIQGPSSGGAETVRSLGELLRRWLAETPYPMPLRLVVAQATCTPPFYTSIAELFEALSHYERSNRQDLVRDVYEHWRGTASVADEQAQEAAATLTPPIQEWLLSMAEPAPAEPAPPPVEAPLPAAGERWKSMRAREIQAAIDEAPKEIPEVTPPQVVVQPEVLIPEVVVQEEPPVPLLPEWWDWHVAFTITSISVLLLLTFWLVASGRGRTAARKIVANFHSTDDRIADSLSPVFGHALDWLGTHPATNQVTRFKPAIVPPAPAPVEAPVVAPPRVFRNSPRGADVVPVSPAATPPSEPSIVSPASTPGPLPSPTLSPASPSASAAGSAPSVAQELPSLGSSGSPSAVVYSTADADVVPPGAIGMRLLDTPPPAAQQPRFTALTIVVDENGHVESATLARKPDSLQDAMLATANLSAAKNWRFLPAVKDGQPVKYRRTVWVPNR